jgi:hypothetical protein
MKRLLLIGGAIAALSVTGCSFVSSAAPGLQNATGEAWYVRTHTFLGIPVGSSVYYCPPQGNTCAEADIR